MRRLIIAVASLVVASTLAACSGDDAEPSAAPTDFADAVAQARSGAEQEGATAGQLAVLDEIAESGKVTMEQLLAARDEYAACLAAVGYTLHDQGVTNANGFPYPDYSIAVPEDSEDDALMDECDIKNFRFVDALYQTQPSAVRAQEDNFTAVMPQLIECVEKGGLEVPADVTADELQDIMMEELRAKIAENPDGLVDSVASACISEVGLTGF